MTPSLAATLLGSTRSGWELLFIAVAGFVFYRMLETRRRRRAGDVGTGDGGADSRGTDGSPVDRSRPPGSGTDRGRADRRPRSAAEIEDDAAAWWFSSGRYGDTDHPPDGDERPS